MGSDFFDKFPLFPFTIVGGVLVQLCAVRFGFESAINRRAVEGLGGLAIDGSQGNVATGFVMVDMVDPSRQTDVVTSYSYRQLITRPILGGGFLTALSMPLIAAWGLPAFTIVTATVTVALTAWGHPASEADPATGFGARLLTDLVLSFTRPAAPR